jgi:hypothetical protein
MNTGAAPLPLVSLVIPVYNGANFLKEAIESALAQTYPHLEIIVVNDGSKDGGKTSAIARSYGDRIRYFEKVNGGVASALNLAVREMRGQFFSWLSHDDLYDRQKVELQVTACLERGFQDHVIVYSDFLTVREDRTQIGATAHLQNFLQADLEKPLFPLLNGLIHGCSLLISRDLFDDSGLFNESLRTTQDYDLWNRMFRKARFVFVPRPLIHSRQHGDQGSRTIPSQRKEMVQLWTDIYSSITEAEMKSLYGSAASFFRAALAFERQHLRLHEIYRLLNLRRESIETREGGKPSNGVAWRTRYTFLRGRDLLRRLRDRCLSK